MGMKRCTKGHYYDESKHTECPYCGIQNTDLKKTMAKTPNVKFEEVKKTTIEEENRTVGMPIKVYGLDPVVGWLVCIEGINKGKDYRIKSEKNFIGRSEKMDITITGDNSISRENHAIISYNPRNNSFKIHAGDGRGLVYLNEEEVDTFMSLKAYDLIEIGDSKLIFIPLCSDKYQWSSKDDKQEDDNKADLTK